MLFSEKTNYVLILVFIILSLLLIFNHEPWRDEAQAWLTARDNPNIPSIINQMGYEGTPALQHLILFPLAKLGLPYFSMAILNFLFMLTSLIIFIIYAPFSKFQKVFFAFGYYIFYEYNVIARSYAISILFLFLIAFIYKERFRKFTLYPLLIVLLGNTNVHSLVIAIVLSSVYVFELKFQEEISIKRNCMAFSIIFLGILVSIYQLWPPSDLLSFYGRWNFDLNISHFMVLPNVVIGAFMPIPELVINFWNTKLISYHLSFYTPKYLSIFSLSLFLVTLSFFVRKPKPMFIYLVSSIGLFGIFFFKYAGALRHHGLIFIVFITSLWIAKNYEDKLFVNSRLIHRLLNQKVLTNLFIFLLSCQVIASPVAFYYELKYDFSAAKRTAAFLKAEGLINKNTLIVTWRSYAESAILPYLLKPYSKFYYLEYNDFGSFLVWKEAFSTLRFMSIEEIVDTIDDLVENEHYSKVLFIFNTKVEGEKKFDEKYDLIAYFNKTIVKDESFYIYKLKIPN